MKLRKLTLANYRGFDQLDLNFADDVTVIAGVNGVGKSGVLKALTSALSLGLPKFTVSRESPLGLSDTDVQSGKPGLSMSVTLDLDAAKITTDLTHAAPLAADKVETLTKRRDDLRFATRETRKGSKEEQDINDEIRLIEIQLDHASDISAVRILPDDAATDVDELVAVLKEGRQQPLAVFYTTSRFLSRLPPALPKTRKLDAATAYDKALNQLEVSLNDFSNWYRVVTSDFDAATKERLFQQLEQAIKTFLPEVRDLALHDVRPPRFSVTKSGQTLFLEQLSDGERGLLALVFDLTRRLAIANPDSDNPITEGEALVLIDEIELHLHPSWQRRVLRLLQSTFTRCQFVVSTHSPQVIGQVKPEKLRLLHHDESGKVVVANASQSFGMDSSWILQNIMGVPARDYETEQRLSAIYQAIDEDKLEEARTLAEQLRADIGDFPDLQEALALLDRFTLLRSG
ncbi:AAA family ATPase [Stenotrophomonas maltophilia]|uniref:AAA family ATPase n=1 Tax=Stenotrophomonas maltophilia TaxID=40324 RepID=UPI0007EF6498|nr:AAA family ATPase [Stenotrophomonas maltophilia]OBU50250.1 ATP-binding protein [Stenotrophomonas maltophilia]